MYRNNYVTINGSHQVKTHLIFGDDEELFFGNVQYDVI